MTGWTTLSKQWVNIFVKDAKKRKEKKDCFESPNMPKENLTAINP